MDSDKPFDFSVNPVLPSVPYMTRSANFFYFNLRRDQRL